jgi:hypothetical protein
MRFGGWKSKSDSIWNHLKLFVEAKKVFLKKVVVNVTNLPKKFKKKRK